MRVIDCQSLGGAVQGPVPELRPERLCAALLVPRKKEFGYGWGAEG